MSARVASPAGTAERLVAWAALIVVLAFLAGVTDVARFRLEVVPGAAPPPAGSGDRDAELVVTALGGDDASQLAAIAGATVRAYWQQGGRLYLAGRGTTGSDGTARLHNLPRGETWVLVEADGRARASTALVLGGEPRGVSVQLGSAHELSVRVLEEGRGAIEAATVLVTASDPLPYGALTDVHGVARLARLGASPWTVKVSARGFESMTRSGVTAPLTVTLRRLGSLEVRVELPSGAPAPGAQVQIAGSGLWPARSAEVDAQGVAHILGLLAGAYDVRALRGDLVSPTALGLYLERGAEKSITLRLEQGRRVTAVVTDGDEPNAAGVPNADVTLAEDGLSSFPLRGRTGADGTVQLGPLPPGPASLVARADEFVPSPAVPIPDNPTEPVRVPLLRGGTLKGEVVDARGRPVDGATIEIIGSDVHGFPVAETPLSLAFRRLHFDWAMPGPVPLIPVGELGVMPGPVPPIPRASDPMPLDVSGAPPSAAYAGVSDEVLPWVTRGDGTFAAHPVTPGRVRALVRHPAYVEGISEAVTLGPGGEASVKVVLLAGGTLEGKLVDAGDRAVGGARIDLVALHGTLERTTLTASDGHFAFAAVPAEVMLSVARPEDPSTLVLRRSVEVAEGARTEIVLKLPAARDSVRVTVRDEDRNAVETAQVSLLSLDPESPLRQTLFTSADGSVTFDDARGLPLRVVVEAPAWAAIAQNVDAAPDSIEITLRRGVLVEGRVTELSGRRPLSGASVTLLAEGRRLMAITDDDGRYRFRDVAPGTVSVSVTHPERANAELSATVERPTRADRAFELPDVDLAEAGEIEGDVVDDKGRPVPGARVTVGVVPAYLPAGALPAGTALTDSHGRFRLRGVAPGPTEVQAYAADLGRGAAHVTVTSGRTASGTHLALSREGNDDEPAARASVAVTLGERGSGDDLEVVIVHVAAASEAERAGLRPGDVLVAVDGAEPASMIDARARLSGPSAADVVIDVERDGSPLRLRVAREPVRR